MVTASAPDDGTTDLVIDDQVARITFNRPAARNAMTWAMYEQLALACDAIEASESVRVVVFRGAGGKAFVAGTDIAQFLEFKSGEDGVAYERAIGKFVGRVVGLNLPTIAVVEGWAVGGGMALANACDFRIATPESRFGVPIARTLGNCLSAGSLAGLTATLGPAMVRRMVLLGELVQAPELHGLGYVLRLAPAEQLTQEVEQVVAALASHAPITMAVTKQLMSRLAQGDTSDEDLIRDCYGSQDFREGVQAFTQKRPPQWGGR
ncbi:MAG: enoyl-CoA hydratase/isomerase family protein [Burkholderiaceae bacterium]